jgi:hypothetical protein
MAEFALLCRRSGEVADVISTHRPLAVVQAATDYEVKPLEEVPLPVLERYRYWSERP